MIRFVSALALTVALAAAAPIEDIKLARFDTPQAPVCFHQEDTEDHKCFEACSVEGKFTEKGIDSPGGCPDQYNTVRLYAFQLPPYL